jgi:hypothetical protein
MQIRNLAIQSRMQKNQSVLLPFHHQVTRLLLWLSHGMQNGMHPGWEAN